MTRRDVDRPSTWVVAAGVTVGFVALLWVLEIIDAIFDNSLDQYGVQPREADGLIGIATAPVLHYGWGHLESNSVPALILGFLVLVTGIARGLQATAVIWLVGGIGVWLLGPDNTVHAGASVLIFGWLTYLIIRGAFTRRAGEIILGMVILFMYGGLLLYGVLPGQEGVSWQGHLFGAIGGALAAFLLGEREDARSSVI